MSGLRARVRAELTAEIKRLARAQMEAQGPNDLNLRAIARELGMVSSAVYRYFASRDELLTALIIDAYDELGRTAEDADAGCDPADTVGRFVTVATAIYRWARTSPSQYLLLFGTPVPGYAAPIDTVAAAIRVTTVLQHILDEAGRQGATPAVAPIVPPTVQPDLATVRALTDSTVSDQLLLTGLQSWTAMFGAITFILNGQFRNVVGDVDALFGAFADLLARQVIGARHD
ncbi:MAG: TetR/AcrR family transcriptional regulator [Acidimicrobiales bacterium]|nr:TetR/AcrR family transcriptional regulator [Acidimicrobiales bacterium]MCB9393689.1 TetR/AcrR family transcriptional regulator [Acidimicrobiaceae bacterium]